MLNNFKRLIERAALATVAVDERMNIKSKNEQSLRESLKHQQAGMRQLLIKHQEALRESLDNKMNELNNNNNAQNSGNILLLRFMLQYQKTSGSIRQHINNDNNKYYAK